VPLARAGADLVVQAKSGTGKTAVFGIAAVELARLDLPEPQVPAAASPAGLPPQRERPPAARPAAPRPPHPGRACALSGALAALRRPSMAVHACMPAVPVSCAASTAPAGTFAPASPTASRRVPALAGPKSAAAHIALTLTLYPRRWSCWRRRARSRCRLPTCSPRSARDCPRPGWPSAPSSAACPPRRTCGACGGVRRAAARFRGARCRPGACAPAAGPPSGVALALPLLMARMRDRVQCQLQCAQPGACVRLASPSTVWVGGRACRAAARPGTSPGRAGTPMSRMGMTGSSPKDSSLGRQTGLQHDTRRARHRLCIA